MANSASVASKGGGLVRAFLRWRPVAYTGLVSYGVYLWHEGWLDKWLIWANRPNVLQLNEQVHLQRTTYPLILGLTVASSVAMATLSYLTDVIGGLVGGGLEVAGTSAATPSSTSSVPIS